MDFVQLRHILAVADTGSFSRAAEAVHITQPGLSRSIAAFERHHGVRLFDRGRGGVCLTPAGALVVAQARMLLASSADLERNLRLFTKGEAGRVAIGLGPMLASLLLPQVGQTMLNQRPGLQASTRVRPVAQLLADLFDGTIEMILGSNWQFADVPGIGHERLGVMPLGVVVRAGHPLTKKPHATVADLERYPGVSPVEMPVAGLGQKAGSLVCENFHILRDIVKGSDAIWRTTPWFVRDDMQQGMLALLDVPELTPTETEIWAVFPRDRSRSPAAKALVQEVQAVIDGIAQG